MPSAMQHAVRLAMVVGLAACASTDDVAALDDRLASMQAEIDALAAQNQALQAQLDSDVQDLREEVAAITEGVDLTNLAELAAQNAADLVVVNEALGVLDARIEPIELEQAAQAASIAANLASTQANAAGLIDQEARLDGLDTDVAALQDTVAEQDTDLADLALGLATAQTAIQANVDDIDANTSDIAANASDIAANTNDIAANAADLATHRDDIDANAADIATNAGDIATNASGVASNTSDIDTNASDIASNANGITENQGGISDNADDIADNAAALADHDELFEASLVNLYPALWEFKRDARESSYRRGHSGLLLHTSGGAFYLGGWVSASGYSTNRKYYVSFYVTNPTSATKTVSLNLCSGDDLDVYRGTTRVINATDRDGDCSTTSFSMPPGDHLVELRYADSNNDLEGIGIRNDWIVDAGLEIDWDTLRSKLELGGI